MSPVLERLAAYAPSDLERVLRLMETPAPKSVTAATDAAALLQPVLMGHEVEHFAVVFLTRQLRVLAVETLSVGGKGYTVVCTRTILRRALILGADSIIVGHNHPSGDAAPSREDLACTRALHAAARTVDIALQDHIIVAGEEWCSLAMRGDMPV